MLQYHGEIFSNVFTRYKQSTNKYLRLLIVYSRHIGILSTGHSYGYSFSGNSLVGTDQIWSMMTFSLPLTFLIDLLETKWLQQHCLFSSLNLCIPESDEFSESRQGNGISSSRCLQNRPIWLLGFSFMHLHPSFLCFMTRNPNSGAI